MSRAQNLLYSYEDLLCTVWGCLQEDFEGIVPAGKLDEEIYWDTKRVGEKFRELLKESQANSRTSYLIRRRQRTEIDALLLRYLEGANRYFGQADWANVAENRSACRNTLLNTLQMIANLTFWYAQLEEQTALSVQSALELDPVWKVHKLSSGTDFGQVSLPLSTFSSRRAVG